MRYAFFIGGLSGFLLAGLAGFLSDRPSGIVFRDAAISCVVAAFLFRWFWSVIVKAFVEVAQQRRREAAEAAAVARSENAKPAGAASAES